MRHAGHPAHDTTEAAQARMTNAFLWSVPGRWICDTPWFRVVPDGVKSPDQNTFRDDDQVSS